MRFTMGFLFFLAFAMAHLSCSTSQQSSQSEIETAFKNFSDGNNSAAKPILENYCKIGERAACTQLGQIFADSGQNEQARTMYEKACNAGDGYGCFLLGELLYKAGTFKEAKSLFKKTQETIYLSGQYLAIIELSEGNVKEAQEILGSQCRHHFAKACLLAGITYETGGQVKKAKDYYTSSCALNFGIGCGYLSTAEIFSGNRSKGEDLATEDCANGGVRSCRITKLLTQIKNDTQLPRQWMVECEKNNEKSCYSLGLYQILQATSLAEGKNTLKKACRLGNGFGGNI